MTLDVALVHYPVCNKHQEIIGSAVTNLDIHDIARAARTFGLENFCIVTPHADQQKLVGELVDHWRHGHGSRYNPDRQEAFSIIRVCSTLDDALAYCSRHGGQRPLTVATSAKCAGGSNVLSYPLMRQHLAAGGHYLLLFGTGWGLAPALMEQVDHVLPPICGGGQYNHLSVRSACSIILDRLLGDR